MKLLCPNCGSQHESGKFCPECGSKLQEVAPELVCPSCNYKAKSGKFCPECGTKLTEQLVAASTETKEEPAKRVFNEKDPRFAKYYDKKGFPRTIPQEERDIAIEDLTPFVSQGIAEAKMLLGNILFGDPSMDAKLKAASLIKEAEEGGNKLAYYLMGMCYFFGVGSIVNLNHDEAERRLKEAYQEYKDGETAGVLATLYTYSEELCDYKKAVDYAKIAAEDDVCDGYLVLGALYLNGWGVEKDVNLALENYKIAAAFGDETAMNQIGFIFMGYNGAEENPEQAFYWFNEASKKNSAVGMFNLGCCYKNGYGIEADVELAAEWLKKAAELGYVDAMCDLGEYYQEVLVDFNKAKMWYLKAAELGNSEAQNKLAVLYADIENDYKEAVKWYKKAMEQDNPWAYRNYAYCLWYGNGVKENKKKAMEMMQKAISLGHPNAEDELNEMQQELANSEKKTAKESKPAKKQEERKAEDITIKNVKFSTDGRKTLFVELDCEYNREYDDFEVDFTVYANNKGLVSASNGEGKWSKNREKFSFTIHDFELGLKTDKINAITFVVEARKLDERWDGTQDITIFPLIVSWEKDINLYYEFHVFGKNVLEIRK